MSGILEAADRFIDSDMLCESYANSVLEDICIKAGPRPAGGESIIKARQILRHALDAAGAVNISEETVNVPLWKPGRPFIKVSEEKEEALECIHCIGSASGDAASYIFDAGAGSKEFIETNTENICGSIVLLRGHVASGGIFVPLSVRLRYLVKAGAKAVILASTNKYGVPAIECVNDPDMMPIPVFSVSKEDGEKLKLHAGKALVSVHADGRSEDALCANLYADLGPDAMPDETIILGAHLDSFCDVMGAFDNLTGVVTAVMIAKLLAPFRNMFKRKLRLIFFTGEELKTLGSISYIKKHKKELNDIRLVINLDSLFPATSRGTAVMFSTVYRDLVEKIFIGAGIDAAVRDMFCMSSDYFPFMMEGLPAIRPADLEDSFPDWSHTVKDDLQNMRFEWIPQNARVYAKLIIRLLTKEILPEMRRLSRKELRNIIVKEGVRDTIRTMGFDI
jgi:hypothetical protein